ncbi:MAG: hypothetical protein FD129_524, partial [bacterium]
RRTVQWIVDYLPDPAAIDPKAEMRSYPDLSMQDRTTIARYLVR